MDSEHWISRLAAAKRFYAAQLGHADRAGMDEVDMDEEVRPEFSCPYCYDDHDVASLCAHLEEEHPFEPHAANRRRLRRFVIPGSQALSLLSRDLREAHLQLLLGGGQRSSNYSTTTNISADPLLSSFGLSFPTSDAEETSKSNISIPDDSTTVKETPALVQMLWNALPWKPKTRVATWPACGNGLKLDVVAEMLGKRSFMGKVIRGIK
ncbi:hypothetical protein PR202_ga05952 [Eleusine coracana subsp. coracana]|uniref:Uncharacterized protein n=1 Tax=Eleusine coracana subsp. coracana TaxID=191504 RepID=A0AAV5BU65_ELECO|nr:hypothetical protein PR202_ga05952 [Eleusine coracana subsp. coracana]